VVGSAADNKLTTHLMNYLLGDVDGAPKVDNNSNNYNDTVKRLINARSQINAGVFQQYTVVRVPTVH